MYEKVLLQREQDRNFAVQMVEDRSPPEMRLSEISLHKRVKLEFTEPMQFPDLDTFIKEANRQRRLA